LGIKIPVKSEHGKIIKNGKRRYLVTVHPAAGLRFPPLKKLLEEDFGKLPEIVRNINKN